MLIRMFDVHIDYTSVILGIALFLGLINWFGHARRHYHGPTIKFEGDGALQWTSIAVGQRE